MDFDPRSPEFIANPYPAYDRMRAAAPIQFREDYGLWLLTAYEDIYTLLRDRRLGRQILHVATREELGWPPERPEHAPFHKLNANSFIELEPPAHTRLCRLVNKAFSPRRVERLRSRIHAIAGDLLARVQPRGRMDLLEDFAEPLPVNVIAELLGVPEADRRRLRPWSRDIVRMYELDHTEEDARRAVQAVEEFSDYLRRLAERRRAQPEDDLITALVQVEDAGERLSQAELIATCILLLNAGHEATVNVIGNGVLALLRHPAQMRRLQDAPALLQPAVEEMLRYDTPLPLFRRWVLEDMEYKGRRFRRGTQLALVYGAGNRDPARFENPGAFDIARRENPHLSFGGGIHYCTGAPLARLEVQIATQTLLQRVPNLQLAAGEPEYRETYIFHGLKAFPVTL